MRFWQKRVSSQFIRKGPGNNDNTQPVKVPVKDVIDLHTFFPKEIPCLLKEYLNACREAKIY